MDTNAAPTSVPRYSYYALAVLTLINFLNYIDRQALPAVAPLMKDDPQLRLTNTELSLIYGAMLLSYTVLAPLFGRLGDKYSRTKLMAVAAIIWSLATGTVGFIDHLPFLPQTVALPLVGVISGGAMAIALTRAVVGVGESSYATITPTLIADYFPLLKRATALGVFQAAIPMGFALGYVISGQLGEYFGWRVAFMLVGFPGMLMALLVWNLREPVRGGNDLDAHGQPLPAQDPKAPSEPWRVTTWRILRTRDWLLSTLGYTALTAVLGTFAAWAVILLNEDKGMTVGSATKTLGLVTLLGGAAGTFVGGWVADKVVRKRANGYWLVCAASSLLGFVPALLVLISGNPYLYLPAIFLTVFFLFINNAPFHAILVNSVPASIRASAVALNIVVIHAFGDLVTNVGVGPVSDALKAGKLAPWAGLAGLLGVDAVQKSLSATLLVAPAALLIGALLFLWGAKGSRTNSA